MMMMMMVMVMVMMYFWCCLLVAGSPELIQTLDDVVLGRRCCGSELAPRFHLMVQLDVVTWGENTYCVSPAPT
jgi:hypothetical protein